MGLCKISLALVFSLGLTLVHLSHAQSSIQDYFIVQESGGNDLSGREAANLWVAEKPYYDYVQPGMELP
uniref:Uncharacterized protein n=1 Tax=Quercus lobata TaxID=97700 RepID=A0A7N2MX22_QUELO